MTQPFTTPACTLCPRQCGAPRGAESGAGFCRSGTLPRVARAALHQWEEPVISGERGSGTVFFSGCVLRCTFCQNDKISRQGFGKTITVTQLRDIYFRLIQAGAHNINLVNPTHFADSILESLDGGLPVPVVYNTGGYDRVETLKRFEGHVQIYLPDYKYALPALGQKFSHCSDYPTTAQAAILEMVRQTGPYVIGSDGLLQRGTVIRHLILPGQLENTFRVIDWVRDTFSPGEVLFSLMSQYTPAGDLASFPSLRRRLTQEEYDAALAYLEDAGISDGFFQELSSAEAEYIPDFDLTGVVDDEVTSTES